MRRALDGNPFVSTGFAEPGYGYFGKHAGYDYGIKEWSVKAPEAGVITNVRIGPLLDGGNIIELRSENYDHRFLHLKSASVSKGQVVSEGQTLGVSGNTGNVGYHLHHDVRKKGTIWTDSFSNYYDWEQIIKGGSEPMFNEGDRVNVNAWLYGNDRGQHKNVVGMNWKQAMENIFSSDYFKAESRINQGDIDNWGDALGFKPQGALGKVWKTGSYEDVMPNVKPPSDQFEEVPFKVFRAKVK